MRTNKTMKRTHRGRRNGGSGQHRSTKNPYSWTRMIQSHLPVTQNITLMGHSVVNVLTDLAVFNADGTRTPVIDSINTLYTPNINNVNIENWAAFADIINTYNAIRFTGITVALRVTNPLVTAYIKHATGQPGSLPSTFDWEKVSTDFHVGRNDLLNTPQDQQWYMRPSVRHTKAGRWIINRLHVNKADLQSNGWQLRSQYFGGTAVPDTPPNLSISSLWSKGKSTGQGVNMQYPTIWLLAVTGWPQIPFAISTTTAESAKLYNAYSATLEYKMYFHFQVKTSD